MVDGRQKSERKLLSNYAHVLDVLSVALIVAVAERVLLWDLGDNTKHYQLLI